MHSKPFSTLVIPARYREPEKTVFSRRKVNCEKTQKDNKEWCPQEDDSVHSQLQRAGLLAGTLPGRAVWDSSLPEAQWDLSSECSIQSEVQDSSQVTKLLFFSILVLALKCLAQPTTSSLLRSEVWYPHCTSVPDSPINKLQTVTSWGEKQLMSEADSSGGSNVDSMLAANPV